MRGRARERSGGLGVARVAENIMFLQRKCVGVGSEVDEVAKNNNFYNENG